MLVSCCNDSRLMNTTRLMLCLITAIAWLNLLNNINLCRNCWLLFISSLHLTNATPYNFPNINPFNHGIFTSLTLWKLAKFTPIPKCINQWATNDRQYPTYIFIPGYKQQNVIMSKFIVGKEFRFNFAAFENKSALFYCWKGLKYTK